MTPLIVQGKPETMYLYNVLKFAIFISNGFLTGTSISIVLVACNVLLVKTKISNLCKILIFV